MITNEDTALAFRFIYLPLARKVLESDLRRISNAGLKFKEPYLLLVEGAINKVGMDIGRLKLEMHRKGMKVIDKGKQNNTCLYLLYCRGYEREIHLFPHLMKNDVQKYVMSYLNK
ncbi:hypothetical protein [Halalkalibacter krulwichiae]|uniref:Uncharacterized protein n=1 Tax=Halalkalibacter krulwichiae TaxID=199441 RepID=A0A1X9MBQ7_9BACI|nr:hypothetical protein [Halalkalibacter krulwichiae]ARK30875.1 hypothetical protein BkAM31D_14080 [Halalkalibacter krulwichiae]